MEVPGSPLYHGNQVDFLSSISSYAINKHGMHIIVNIHSLPSGVNGMGLRETKGHYGWFHNETALEYSLQAVDAVIDFIQSSAHPESFTLQPINEPVDVQDMSLFGTPACLSDAGAEWLLSYMKQVIAKVESVNRKIPVVFQGSFKGDAYWAPHFDADANLVFNVQNYYFAGRGASATNMTDYICSDARVAAEDGKFPVFVGEWSIQAEINNTSPSRKRNFHTGVANWRKYTQGSAFWTARFSGNGSVDGEGTQAHYWNHDVLIDLGYTSSTSEAVSC